MFLLLFTLGCTSGPGAIRAGAPGSRDDSGVDSGVDTGTPAQGGELRGVWVTRWSYGSVEDVQTIMEEIQSGGFNTVFFQVRGSFDAFYDSGVEPWSEVLSGTLGQDPGWDPLAVAVEEGHERGLQVHAYINTFPFWRGASPPPDTTPEHAYNTHPDWLVADASGEPMALNTSYVFASPGNAEVREHIAAVTSDIAERYDVDGIHLDYVRYPGSDYSHDAASESSYARDDLGMSWEDWEREQVNLSVAEVYDSVDVPVTAAVWGIYQNSFGWSGVSEGYSDFYQDSGAFLAQGVLDAIVPMIYWPVTDTPGDRLDFRTLVADHVSRAAGRHVYAGFGNDITYEQAVACVRAARDEGADGVVLFDWSLFRDHMHDFQVDVFSEPADPPAMPWR